MNIWGNLHYIIIKNRGVQRGTHSHPNHAEGVYIINSEGIVYHQCEALHIIKPQARYTLARDEIQGRLAALDDIHRTLCGDAIPSLRLG